MRYRSKSSHVNDVVFAMIVVIASAQALALQDPAAPPQDAKKDAAQEKVITDQAEGDAYMAGFNATDPAKKAEAMESFLQKYPNSVVKLDAMQQAMSAYQVLGDTAKIEAAAQRVLGVQPDDVKTLAVLAFLVRQRASSSNDAKAAVAASDAAQRGLKALPEWKRPDVIADADFEKLKRSMSAIFYGAVGYGSFAGKEYANARLNYLKALALDPNNMFDNYQLGISDMSITPADMDGMWYLAKATSLAKGTPAALKVIEAYAKTAYQHYHNASLAGWDALVASAAKADAPPAAAAAKPAPAKKPVKK